jgi:hypothetical protein
MGGANLELQREVARARGVGVVDDCRRRGERRVMAALPPAALRTASGLTVPAISRPSPAQAQYLLKIGDGHSLSGAGMSAGSITGRSSASAAYARCTSVNGHSAVLADGWLANVSARRRSSAAPDPQQSLAVTRRTSEKGSLGFNVSAKALSSLSRAARPVLPADAQLPVA